VLLPQPLGPMIATNSPDAIARSSPRNTSFGSRRVPPGNVNATWFEADELLPPVGAHCGLRL
jgi:hypothetical protein